MVAETRYVIREKTVQDVSSSWKVGHILCFLVIIASSFSASYSFGVINKFFAYNCILYANVTFQEPSVPENVNTFNMTIRILSVITEKMIEVQKQAPKIDVSKTLWGRPGICNYCQSVHLIGALAGLTFGIFVALSAKGGKGYKHDILPKPWRLVYPLLFISGIFSVVNLLTTSKQQAGFYKFCSQFSNITELNRCSSFLDVYTVQFNEEQQPFYSFYLLLALSTYVSLGAWFFQTFLLLIRILSITDFTVHKLTIYHKDAIKDKYEEDESEHEIQKYEDEQFDPLDQGSSSGKQESKKKHIEFSHSAQKRTYLRNLSEIKKKSIPVKEVHLPKKRNTNIRREESDTDPDRRPSF